MSTQTKNNINWHLAELCIDVSKVVYGEKPEVVKFLKDNKIKHSSVKFFEKENAQGYGIVMPDYMIVAFRGTEGAQIGDLIADIKAWPAGADTTGTVHSGFKTELDKLYPQIIKWLGKNLTTKKIVITGHSLGAAMATICASRFHQLGADLELYTYGSPKVGDRAWGEQFKDIAAYRFVNNNDLVTRVPFFGYYKHVGQIHYITYDVHIKTKVTWWQRFKDRMKGTGKAFSKFQFFDGLYDHFGNQYIKKIKTRK